MTKCIFLLIFLVGCNQTTSNMIKRDYDLMSKAELSKELKEYDSGKFNIDVKKKDNVITATATINGREATTTVLEKRPSFIPHIILASAVLILFFIVRFKFL